MADSRRGFAPNGFERAILDPERIERCSHYCLEPTVKSCQALEAQCDWSWFLSNRVPACRGRRDNQSRRLPDRDWCPGRAELETLVGDVDLPAPLLAPEARSTWPEFFRHVN